ncbi:porphobilinogen synthase, partial [Streptomyces sp. NPDC001274]
MTVYGNFPGSRPRRLRTTPAMRRMVAETRLDAADLILPAFVREGIDAPVAISTMPGVVQHTLDTLRKAAVDAVSAGV